MHSLEVVNTILAAVVIGIVAIVAGLLGALVPWLFQRDTKKMVEAAKGEMQSQIETSRSEAEARTKESLKLQDEQFKNRLKIIHQKSARSFRAQAQSFRQQKLPCPAAVLISYALHDSALAADTEQFDEFQKELNELFNQLQPEDVNVVKKFWLQADEAMPEGLRLKYKSLLEDAFGNKAQGSQ